MEETWSPFNGNNLFELLFSEESNNPSNITPAAASAAANINNISANQFPFPDDQFLLDHDQDQIFDQLQFQQYPSDHHHQSSINVPPVFEDHDDCDQCQDLNFINPKNGGFLGSNLKDLTIFKVGKLSAEQRKEKIHRYMKKRNKRNFTKKIKYPCRKTLADSRHRVRGRFAKNYQFGDLSSRTSHEKDTSEDLVSSCRDGEDDHFIWRKAISHRPSISRHGSTFVATGMVGEHLNKNIKLGSSVGNIEDDRFSAHGSTFVANQLVDEQIQPPRKIQKVVVKAEEEDIVEVFAHISGVNSLKCNYSIQSWMSLLQ